jgi:predicted SnoaL-like aldol condensation-catalyzing enzyme
MCPKKYLGMILCGWIAVLLYACASIGQPDGGPYDEDPPKFIKSEPVPFAVNNQVNKVVIEFDEYIKLDKPAEKVIISPPQIDQPEIKASGHRVIVNLQDSLKENTTYTFAFGDAIQDNNEGNALENFSFTFSTGESIDTMEVSGVVLNAQDLEPIKNIAVGLHADLADSAFTTKPFDRISRTDSRGHFTIRGIAPGKYHIFALNDGNQNYLYDSKTEQIAFLDSIIIPDMTPATRQDTVWRDTLTIDTIRTVNYTRFLPDDIVLRAFKAENDRRYLSRNTRDKENHFTLVFSTKSDTLPRLRGLNFDSEDAFILEKTATNDSLCYWIKDSLVYKMDTLEVQIDYFATDTLNRLALQTDTIYLANKLSREQRARIQKKTEAENEKARKKARKKGEEADVDKTKFLTLNLDAPSQLDLNKNITFAFEEPISSMDSAAIHLEQKVDTLWQEVPFIFEADTAVYRQYNLLAEWQPQEEYRLTVDSMAFVGLYGLHTDKQTKTFKVKSPEDYATLLLDIFGAEKGAIVELIDNNGKVLRQQPLSDNNTADFYYLSPGTKYYVRMFIDRNGNGVWDTGNYDAHLQPEEVYYFPKIWDLKANFEFEEKWDVKELPLEKQKLDEIKKQKPEKDKKAKNRNAERLKKLGRSA